jgi:hypothetical protein
MEDSLNVTTSLNSTGENSKLPPISPELLATVKSITSKLPIYNFCLLQLLCKHLKSVADNEKENRMSISNLALIFIPTLNIGRALFHCMVEHYTELFEGNKLKRVPPPLPQKPPKLVTPQKPPKLSLPKLSTSSLPTTRKIVHTKTMSDTDIINKVPPPKPSRSPSIAQKRVPPAVKPRSKSVSVPALKENNDDYDKVFWKQTGRVEAIGKQFETLMNSKSTTSSLKK